MTAAAPKSSFLILLTGQIEKAEFHNISNIYCKYSYVYGPDWSLISGIEEGLSPDASGNKRIVLNTPLEATFSSTNPFLWPQIVISCYGRDRFGNDVIRGYGATHIPTTPGRIVPVFVPQSSTTLQKILSYFTGRRAEFIDPRIVSASQGRAVTRVVTQGFVYITFDVVMKDFKKFGYDVCPQTLSRTSDYPLPNFEEKFSQLLAKEQPPPRPIEQLTELNEEGGDDFDDQEDNANVHEQTTAEVYSGPQDDSN